MKIHQIAAQALLVVLSILLTGCFWPEKFIATLDIEKDRSFVFVYDGILAYAPAVAEIKESGGLSSKDDSEIAELEIELKKDSSFKSVSYVGEGRFKVRYERSGVIDQTIHLFGKDVKLVTLSPSGDGIAIDGMRVSDKDRQELQEINLGFDGTLHVRSALEVVQDNANSKPMMGFGSHEWKLNWGTQEVPRLVTSGLAVTKPIGISIFLVLSIVAVVAFIIWRKLRLKRTPANVEPQK